VAQGNLRCLGVIGRRNVKIPAQAKLERGTLRVELGRASPRGTLRVELGRASPRKTSYCNFAYSGFGGSH